VRAPYDVRRGLLEQLTIPDPIAVVPAFTAEALAAQGLTTQGLLDQDAGGQTTLVVGPARSPRGRGLLMVAQAAQDWGMRGDSAGGKTVWAAIGCQDTDPCPEPVARPADDVLDRPPPADKPEPTEQT
jgi:hypothetical protein